MATQQTPVKDKGMFGPGSPKIWSSAASNLSSLIGTDEVTLGTGWSLSPSLMNDSPKLMMAVEDEDRTAKPKKKQGKAKTRIRTFKIVQTVSAKKPKGKRERGSQNTNNTDELQDDLIEEFEEDVSGAEPEIETQS